MLPSKKEPDYIKEFNTELEVAYYKAIAKLCLATGKSLSHLNYNGFVLDYHRDNQIKLVWEVEATLVKKEEQEKSVSTI